MSLVGVGYIVSQTLNFGAYLVLARLLSPNDFGLYAAGTLITGIGGLFAESGMLAALIKREDRLDEAASTAFAWLALSGIGLTLASLAVSPLIGLAFHRGEVTELTAVLSAWLLIRALTVVPDALLQRRFSFLRRVLVDPLGVIAYAAVAIPLAASGSGVWAMVAGAYASILTQVVASWLASGFRPRRHLMSVAMWKELASVGRPLIISEILRRITTQIDVFMLGRFSGTAVLGQYRNGQILSQQPGGLFSQAASYVILPAFARISAVPERIGAAARRAYWVAYVVIVPMSLASIPLGVPVAVIVLGDKWRPAGHAIAGLSGMVLGGTLLSISGELSKAAGLLRFQIRVGVVSLALVGVSVIVAGVLWGLLGVAIAVSLSACATSVYAMAGIARALKMPAHGLFDGLIGPLTASLVMIGAMLVFAQQVGVLDHAKPVRPLFLIAEIAIGALVYVVVLASIDPGRRELGASLWQALIRRIRRQESSTQAGLDAPPGS